jgi:hypothetical protein
MPWNRWRAGEWYLLERRACGWEVRGGTGDWHVWEMFPTLLGDPRAVPIGPVFRKLREAQAYVEERRRDWARIMWPEE